MDYATMNVSKSARDYVAKENGADSLYYHVNSKGEITIVFVTGNDRWHYIDGTTRKMILPWIPTDIAGRYALGFYDLNTRKGRRRFHDDYMMPGSMNRWRP